MHNNKLYFAVTTPQQRQSDKVQLCVEQRYLQEDEGEWGMNYTSIWWGDTHTHTHVSHNADGAHHEDGYYKLLCSADWYQFRDIYWSCCYVMTHLITYIIHKRTVGNKRDSADADSCRGFWKSKDSHHRLCLYKVKFTCTWLFSKIAEQSQRGKQRALCVCFCT